MRQPIRVTDIALQTLQVEMFRDKNVATAHPVVESGTPEPSKDRELSGAASTVNKKLRLAPGNRLVVRAISFETRHLEKERERIFGK